jgi:uncharacterized membrane protein HdeD (DUF308 family)
MVTNANVTKLEIPHVHWWLILLEGIAAFVVGILILAAPGISALALTQLLGAYWLVSGIFSLVSIFTNRMMWGWKLVSGALGVVAGLAVLQYPMWSAVLVPAVAGVILGIDGILIGVSRLVMSYRGAGWGVAILGVVSVLLGFVLLLFPPLAILTAIYAFAFLFIAGGIAAFFTALNLRRGGEVSVVMVPSPFVPVPIPVTGQTNEEIIEAETEHEGEETGEYTGESSAASGMYTPSGQIPVTGNRPEPEANSQHQGDDTSEYGGNEEGD